MDHTYTQGNVVINPPATSSGDEDLDALNALKRLSESDVIQFYAYEKIGVALYNNSEIFRADFV